MDQGMLRLWLWQEALGRGGGGSLSVDLQGVRPSENSSVPRRALSHPQMFAPGVKGPNHISSSTGSIPG